MSVLVDIQTNIEERLQDATLFGGLDYFRGVTIIKEDKGDITNQIQQALGPVAGLCVVILMMDADNELPNVPTPALSNIIVAVNILENVTINRAQDSYKTCNDVAEHVMLYCTLYKPDDVNEVFVLDREALRIMDNPPPPATLGKIVKFRTSAGITLSS